jgi:transcriptional regulator with XRE-family HTH domain
MMRFKTEKMLEEMHRQSIGPSLLCKKIILEGGSLTLAGYYGYKKGRMPSAPNLFYLANVLGSSMEEFLEETEVKEREVEKVFNGQKVMQKLKEMGCNVGLLRQTLKEQYKKIYSYEYLFDICNGKKKPQVRTVELIAKLLLCKPQDLYDIPEEETNGEEIY